MASAGPSYAQTPAQRHRWIDINSNLQVCCRAQTHGGEIRRLEHHFRGISPKVDSGQAAARCSRGYAIIISLPCRSLKLADAVRLAAVGKSLRHLPVLCNVTGSPGSRKSAQCFRARKRITPPGGAVASRSEAGGGPCRLVLLPLGVRQLPLRSFVTSRETSRGTQRAGQGSSWWMLVAESATGKHLDLASSC